MNGRTILLVEDNLHIREAFSLLLEDSGCVVRTAATGAEAIGSAAQNPPELVLLDLGLPDMRGLEVARAIKRQPQGEQIPIIALTGHTLDADRVAAREAGCVGYLTKPINTAALLAALREFLPASR